MQGMQRLDAHAVNEVIKEKLTKYTSLSGKMSTDINSFFLSRRIESGKIEDCIYEPSVGIVVQGGKSSLIGTDRYRYGAHSCLISGIDIPATYYVIGASNERPFLALSLKLDKAFIAQLLTDMPADRDEEELSKGVSITDADGPLLDAFLRLLDMLDSPQDIPVLAPLVIREVHYRLFTGPQGKRLRLLFTPGSQSQHVALALNWLKENYTKPVQVHDLAEKAFMSESTFHRHFKELTSMSPLQYQKQLRLHEARRLMVVDGEDVTRAGFAVGYESIAQFSREYKRCFGASPSKDLAPLRQARQEERMWAS